MDKGTLARVLVRSNSRVELSLNSLNSRLD